MSEKPGWTPRVIPGGQEKPLSEAERANELCERIARRYGATFGSNIESDLQIMDDFAVNLLTPERAIQIAHRYIGNNADLDQQEVLRLYRKLRSMSAD